MSREPWVLMVDDDSRLVGSVSEYLGANGLRVTAAARGEEAFAEIRRTPPDLVMLDIMLPDVSGFEVCRRIRAASIPVPVLFLTAKEEDYDHVLGIEIGADDYLKKPVAPRILLAHVRALLRRSAVASPKPESDLLQFGALSINRLTREVRWREERVTMTSAEFDLLWLLASNAGELMHRDDILRRLRGLEAAQFDRSVDARLYRLRRRFGDTESVHRRIRSVRPHRYLFSVEPW